MTVCLAASLPSLPAPRLVRIAVSRVAATRTPGMTYEYSRVCGRMRMCTGAHVRLDLALP